MLTVPLLLIELILVMGLPPEEKVAKSWSLGVASTIMVALGYPDEIYDNPKGRWMWSLQQLAVRLSAATDKSTATW